MKVRLCIAAAIMIVPTIAAAQRGMGGGGGGRRGGRGGGDESRSEAAKAAQLSADGIQKLNPAKVLLDKRKDLKIDDAQKAQLETIANRYDWNTRVFVAMVDSLQGAAGNRAGRGRMSRGRAGGDDSAPDTARVTGDEERRARNALVEALQSVRQEYDTASARSLNVLTETQRKQAAKLIEKPTAEIGDQLEKAGFVRPLDGTPAKPPA